MVFTGHRGAGSFHGDGLVAADERLDGPLGAAEMDLETLHTGQGHSHFLKLSQLKLNGEPFLERLQCGETYLRWMWDLKCCLCRGFDHNHSLFPQTGDLLDILICQIGKCNP